MVAMWHGSLHLFEYYSSILLSPFYVDNKEMSVRMFILGFVFPVPVMLVYYAQKCVRMKNVKKSLQTVVEIQSGTSSLSVRTVVSEQNRIVVILQCFRPVPHSFVTQFCQSSYSVFDNFNHF